MLSLLLVLVALLACAVGALVLFGYGCGHLLPGAARVVSRPRLRGVAGLAGAAALALYAWGLLGVGGAVLGAEDGGADSSPVIPCRTGDAARDAAIAGYSVAYVPLGFVCETTGGGTYTTDDVPPYVNPGVALFAFDGVVAACLVGFGSRNTVRSRSRPG